LKIISLVGTRPELIRLSIIIEKLDKILGNNHIFVYTNQNYDPNLKDIFFKQLDIRKPNYSFKNEAVNFGDFFANAIVDFDLILQKEEPDKILVLGDTNSGLLTIIAQKYNIPIYHMEAGNRCFDRRVPEEVNRRVIDNIASYNLPYTENAKQNLLNEGFHKNYIYKIGNPIFEVLNKHRKFGIRDSNILNRLNLIDNCKPSKDFILVTCHRSENVDNIDILENIKKILNYISKQYKVIFSVHPRTRQRINSFFKYAFSDNIILSEPFGFFDFVQLEQHAKIVITDSGTVQEECAIFKIPCIIIRESTERQELIDCGAGILTGTKTQNILNAFDYSIKRENTWEIPKDYKNWFVSDTVINILLGKS